MNLLLIPALAMLGVSAFAQEQPAGKQTAPAAERGAPKGRQQPMERHTRTTWHYHSGPKRSSSPSDTSAAKATPSTQSTTDAGN